MVTQPKHPEKRLPPAFAEDHPAVLDMRARADVLLAGPVDPDRIKGRLMHVDPEPWPGKDDE